MADRTPDRGTLGPLEHLGRVTIMPPRDKKTMFQCSLLCLGGFLFNQFLFMSPVPAGPRAVAAANAAMLVGSMLCTIELLRYSKTTKTVLLTWSGLSLGILALVALFWSALPQEATGGARYGQFAAEQVGIWAVVTGVIALTAAGVGGARESIKEMAAALRGSRRGPHEKWAAARGLAPVTDPTRRYESEGVSVQPPGGDDWFAVQRPMGILAQLKMRPNLAFTRIARSSDLARPGSVLDRLRSRQTSDPSTTFAQVSSGFIDVPAGSGADVLEQLARDRLAADEKETASGGRVRTVQFRTSPDTSLGTDCLWYDATSEDRGVPWQRGIPFNISERGVFCAHPDCRWFVINAVFSYRGPRGTARADFTQEAERFLRSLKFNRLRRPLPVGVIAVGMHPRAIAIGKDAVWVASVSGETLSRVDRETNEVVATISIGTNPAGVAVTDDTVWVANMAAATLSRIDTRTNRVVAAIPVGAQPLLVAADATAVWLTHGTGDTISRIDPKTNQVSATIRVDRGADAIAVGEGFVWATSGKGGLVRIDPYTNRVSGHPRRVSKGSGFVATGEGAVWVSDPARSAVVRVDPRSCRVVTTIPVASPPYMIAVGMGAVWTTNTDRRVISKIDPQTNRVVETVPAAGRPYGIAIGEDAIWVGNGAGNAIQRLAY